ncbi:Yip1 family protein [Methanoculleus frigidifontis]|nr:Yip1 family protein [Methanoculleus sp. FWC-SCC1]
MAGTTQDLFLNPRAFFDAKKAEGDSLKVPALIVLAIGIVSAISAYVLALPFLQYLPSEIAGLGPVLAAFGGIFALVMVLVVWVLFAGVFYGISALLGGEGSFKQTLAFVGYGYAPQLVGTAIYVVFVWLFMANLVLPPASAISDPTIFADLMKDPYIQIGGIINLLFVLWSANIWIFGVKSARNLSLKNAAIAVGIPVALYVLYTLFSLL